MLSQHSFVAVSFRYALWLLFPQLLAASSSITVQVSNEIAPPGGYAQFKVSLPAPALVSIASVTMTFDPAIFGPITSVAAFSATGDETGFVYVYGNSLSLQAALTSASSSFGQLPGLPVFVVTVPVLTTAKIGATSSINVDVTALIVPQPVSPWQDQNGNGYTVNVIPGTFTVGGTQSIESITPGGGLLPSGTVVQINGTGFDPTTTVTINGVVFGSAQWVSAQEIDVTLAGSTEMSGKHVHIGNAAGESHDYFAALADGSLTEALKGTVLILPSLPSPSYTTVQWPYSDGDLDFFACVQNLNAFSVTATFYAFPFSPAGTASSQAVVIPPYGLYVANTDELTYQILPTSIGPLYMTSAAPLRMALFTMMPDDFAAEIGVPSQATGVTLRTSDVRTANPSTTGMLSVSPTSLSFTLTPGESAPSQPQMVSLRTPASGLSVSVSTQSGGNWLIASLAGVAVNAVAVNVNASAVNLGTGVYQGTVTITSATPSAVAMVPVTLTVAPPFGPGQLAVSPLSLVITGPANTTASGVLSVNVVSGAPYFNVLAQNLDPVQFESGQFLRLQVTPSSTTTQYTAPAAIQVTASAALPGTYRGSVVVSWNGGSATIPVTYYATAAAATPPVMSAIVNSGSALTGPIAPGEIISIFGEALAGAPSGPQIDSSGNVATTLAGTQVFINGITAPLIYVSTGQINAIVPYEVDSGSASVQIMAGGIQSSAWAVPVAPSAPSIFTVTGSGVGEGAVVNADGSTNSEANPAARGSIIQIYATGGGQTSAASSTGSIAQTTAILDLPVNLMIGGVNAQVLYAGAATGEASGVIQMNVVVPQTVSPGGALPVVAIIGGESSQSGVTIAIQ